MFNEMLVSPDGNIVSCVAFPHLPLVLPEPCRSELLPPQPLRSQLPLYQVLTF